MKNRAKLDKEAEDINNCTRCCEDANYYCPKHRSYADIFILGFIVVLLGVTSLFGKCSA